MNRLLAILFTTLLGLFVLSGCGGGGGGGGGSAPTPSTAKAITSFSLAGVSATINEGSKTIAVTVPFGTDVTNLIATFTTTGAGVTIGVTSQISTTTANNFTSQVVYTVTAEDGSSVNYTVTVTVAPNCEPLNAYMVDSAVVYGGIATPISVYATAPTWPVTVALIPQAGGSSIALTVSAGSTADLINAVVPAGLAAGIYNVTVSDSHGCTSTLNNALAITNALTVTLKSAEPNFVVTSAHSTITVTRDSAAAAPGDMPFVATPRLYLVPASGSVVEIDSVAFISSNTLQASIPANLLAEGLYDLVLVNPDGSAGLLMAGFRAQSAPAPVVNTVTPTSIVNAAGQSITLSGTNFSGTAVTASCVDGTSAPVAAPAIIVTGAPNCSGGQCTVGATVDGSTLSAGSVCVLHATNSDGAYGDYSALSIIAASRNLNAPKPGSQMVTGRRALNAAAVVIPGGKRFVYAIGGDTGTSATPLATVEMAQTDRYGNLGSWTTLPYSLAQSRTLAGSTTIGRYIYVFGGSNGSVALSTTERAMALDPSEVPRATLSEIATGATGLDVGAYIYSVSAVFDVTFADNPGGESLPSSDVIVRVPSLSGALSGKKVQVTLAWTAPVDNQGNPLPSITGYRIYRTDADGGTETKRLLATAPANTTSYLDTGATPGSETPLPLGSLGKWLVLPSLITAREGVAGAAARDPADPAKWYVYALLGRQTPASALPNYEYLSITIDANGHQIMTSPWKAGQYSNPTARWQHGAWVANNATSPNIAAGSTYIYVGGGLTAAGAAVNSVDAGLVSSGGDLGVWNATPSDFTGGARAGYGICAANQQLMAFGGTGATASNGIVAATIGISPPSLAVGAWNSIGVSLTDSRYLMGSAVQGPFVYLLGGQSGTSSATNTVDFISW